MLFHLTRYKYLFFGISLAVIVPGLLALIFWHLNPGIDFTGGTTINLRFANPNVTTTQIHDAFTAAGAKDVGVYATSDLSSDTQTTQYVYISFDKPIGKNVEQAVLTDLGNIDKNNSVTLDQTYYTYGNGSNPTALMVVHFNNAVKTDAVSGALKSLPASDAPPAIAPSGTTGGAAQATATPSSNGSNGSQTHPVSVSKVQLGENTYTYEVDTQTPLDVTKLDQIVFTLGDSFGPVYVQSKTFAGAAIGGETTRNAIIAVALAALAILIYIAIAFRKVGSVAQSFRFGASAIIALLHDVLVVLGLWAIFGRLFDFKVDSLFLTAVLTVIGFSVHDTIVVFDRIRENLSRRTSESFEQITNASLVQTMSRSLNTSLTVLLTLAALTLFGGASIREFTLALLIGIMSGTYSSIFNASMLLVVWETGEWKRWFGRQPKSAAVAGRRELAGSRA